MLSKAKSRLITSVKKISTLVVAIIFSVNGFAQAPPWLWAKGIGGLYTETSFSVDIDAFRNVYLTGVFQGTVDFDPGAGVFNLTSAGSEDVFISKLDSNGNFVWAKSISGNNTEYAFSLSLDLTGNIYLAGQFWGTTDFDTGPGTYNLTSNGIDDIFVVKLDSAGNLLWARSVGSADNDKGQSLILEGVLNGSVYITGYFEQTVDFDPGAGVFNLTAADLTDIFVLKLDYSGNFVWAKAMGGSTGDAIKLDPLTMDVIVAGKYGGTADFDPGPSVFNLTSVGGPNPDIFITKLDSSGNFVWAVSAGGGWDDRCNSIAVDSNGTIYATGTFKDTADFDPGPSTYYLITSSTPDTYILKLNSLGNFIWAKSIGGQLDDYAYDIKIEQTERDIYLTGSFYDTADFDPGPGIYNLISYNPLTADIFVLKLDSMGDFNWVVSAGGSLSEGGTSLAVLSPDNLYVTGRFAGSTIAFGSTVLVNNSSPSTLPDIFITKLGTLIITGHSEVENFNYEDFISPNPATNELRIKNAELRIESVEVYDVMGKRCLTPTLSKGEGVRLDVSSLANGIYFVKMRGEEEERVAKFVKQ